MDNERWQEDIRGKSSLKIYVGLEEKKEIKEEQVYDNRPSSVIMHRARTNCLKGEVRLFGDSFCRTV